jgi:hypothetical protein
MPLGLFRGVRKFTLQSFGADVTRFTMEEAYSGPPASLIVKAIPDFDESFAQFADGLKTAAPPRRAKAAQVWDGLTAAFARAAAGG